jgi:hypothetical protein
MEPLSLTWWVVKILATLCLAGLLVLVILGEVVSVGTLLTVPLLLVEVFEIAGAVRRDRARRRKRQEDRLRRTF